MIGSFLAHGFQKGKPEGDARETLEDRAAVECLVGHGGWSRILWDDWVGSSFGDESLLQKQVALHNELHEVSHLVFTRP